MHFIHITSLPSKRYLTLLKMAELGIVNLISDDTQSEKEKTKAPQMHPHWKQQAVSG